jgi:hypothetical protein
MMREFDIGWRPVRRTNMPEINAWEYDHDGPMV